MRDPQKKRICPPSPIGSGEWSRRKAKLIGRHWRRTKINSSKEEKKKKKLINVNVLRTTQSLWTVSAPEFTHWWRGSFNEEMKKKNIPAKSFLPKRNLFLFFIYVFYFVDPPNRSKSKSKSNSNALLNQQKKEELLFRGTNSFRQVSPTDPSWEQMHYGII